MDARTFSLDNWMEPPFNRPAFQRVREIVPTALIRNHSGSVRLLSYDLQPLDDLRFRGPDGTERTWGEHLADSYCDAVCVVHDSRIVYERYLNGMTAHTPHLLMSVSKSFCGAALGISIGRGLVAAEQLVCDIVPELAGTSLDGATVQHVIDMTAGTDFVEDYDLYDEPDGHSALIEYERQAGYRRLGAREAIGMLGHFRTYGTAYPHGDHFEYRSPLTNIAARILEVVNEMRYPDVVSRDLWGPLGQEHDADIMLDPTGQAVVEGGMSCTVRDLARLGLAYLGDGSVMGNSVVPSAWVDDTRHGTDAAAQAFRVGDPESAALGWAMYRNAFWVFERGEVFSGLGIFGQYCYVNRRTGTVIARFSTYPSAVPDDLTAETLAGFDAVSAHLAAS